MSTRNQLLVTLGAGVLIGMGLWSALDVMLRQTASAEFCGGCHTMQGSVESYRNDFHGGNNKEGMAVLCTDCHLPQNSQLAYLKEKIAAGFKNIWLELTFIEGLEVKSKHWEKMDHCVSCHANRRVEWRSKVKAWKTSTYDSGCLKCHSFLKETRLASQKAFIEHQRYFEVSDPRPCVSCHESAGHFRL
ncbi:NapC/NirT family cytochrome c [Deltaproteobacteria bacterium TL4]